MNNIFFIVRFILVDQSNVQQPPVVPIGQQIPQQPVVPQAQIDRQLVSSPYYYNDKNGIRFFLCLDKTNLENLD